jgi:uncharacterized protein involved in exopolysaccharide biosynthesis
VTDTEESEEAGAGFDPEILRSYLAFGKRAIGKRVLWVALVFVTGMVLTFLAFRYLPRTFTCRTILLAEGSRVLEEGGGAQTLSAAPNLIMRHENLEALIREIGLVEKFYERRPPLLKQKDRIMAAVFGELSEEIKVDVLVGTLENRLNADIEGSTLIVSVDWNDPETAAEVAEAARESFVRTRHSAELSAFQEKLAILDGHATKLRAEVERLAEQISGLREKKAEEARAALPAPSASAAPAPRAVPRRVALPVAPDAQAPVLKEALEAKKRKLAELEGDRERRLREERAKISELKLRLTPSHPDVVTAEQRLAVISQEPSEIALLRAEIGSLDSELKQRDALAKRDSGSPGLPGLSPSSATVEPVPTEIVGLLEDRNIDPALAAQLYGAIAKYSALRDDIRSGRIQLDTAQAAFQHRYKIVVPADPPGSPVKPKIGVIVTAGFLASLFVALILPILAELRTGIIVERWQVQRMNLPVLAELKLPQLSSDSERSPGPPGG